MKKSEHVEGGIRINLRRLCVAGLAIGLLTACAVDPIHKSGPKEQLSADKGYLLLSMGPAKLGALHYNVVLRQLATGTETSLLFTTGDELIKATPADYTESGLPGTVFHLPLPPGSYGIVRYRVHPPSTVAAGATERFTVVSGKTTYVGRFRVGRETVDGASKVKGEMLNRYEEDLAIAQKRFPEVLAAFPMSAEVPQ